MTTFTLSVDVDNAAFTPDPQPEVARILRALADGPLVDGGRRGGVRDVNGNTVGSWGFTVGPWGFDR